MNIFSKIRRTVFWLKDLLLGSNVTKHYNDILENFNKKEENSAALNKLLNHTIKNVSFYKDLGANSTISDFQVINKSIIRNNVDLFISDGLDKNSLIQLTTSGSTGTPFTVYQDKNKKSRNTADSIVFGKLANYGFGNKLYYLKIWSEANKKSKWTRLTQNIEPIDVLDLNDEKIHLLLGKLKNESSPFAIMGYASALETLSNYFQKNNISRLNTKITSVMAISETLHIHVKDKLSSVFGIPVVSRYSNVENGILGQQSIDGTHGFVLNTASYYFEIFDLDKDELLPYGEIGRIVITDLYNFAMPMIRYDTGDVGCLEICLNTGKLLLKNLHGRKLDLLYNTTGQLVNSLLVYKNMWQYKEIDQYQLAQTGIKTYELRINCKNGFTRSAEIISEYKTYLGADADIKIIDKTEIPLLASGKRRKVVQEYYI